MLHVDTAFILGCAIPAGGAFRGGILRDPDLDDRGGRMTDAREMTRHFGGRWYGAYGVAPCPVCQPEGKTGQCALTLRDGSNGRLLAHCKKLGCGFGEILSAAGLQSGVYCPPDPLELARRERVEKAQASKRATQAKTIWDTAQPVRGTVADHYLRGRGITCLLPSTLRFHANCWHAATAKRHPALIAAVQGSGLPAVHRTYLCVDGAGKANIDPPKAMLGAVAGGAVRLCNDTGPLVVGEGLESTLSLLCGLWKGPATVWAALSTSGMRKLCLPTEPGKLVIAMDGDKPGREAGHALAHRANGLGWQVSLFSAPEGRDFNDVLTAEGALA